MNGLSDKTFSIRGSSNKFVYLVSTLRHKRLWNEVEEQTDGQADRRRDLPKIASLLYNILQE